MEHETIRVVLYSHDALGLGHLRRNLALAHQIAHDLPRLAHRQVTGLLIVGTSPPASCKLPAGFDWLVLPGLSKREGSHQPRHLLTTASELVSLRSCVLLGALSSWSPHLVIVDRYPFGVRQELREPLAALRARNPRARIVLGLREVLDEPGAASAEWSALEGRLEEMLSTIDEVWVYGDRRVHDPLSTGEVPENLHDRTVFTGYLADGRHLLDTDTVQDERPYVLTTVGGGADGEPILRAAAAMRAPAGHSHIIVTGPQADPALLAQLRATARPGTFVHRTVPGLSRRLEQASAVIAMGGYNTACELMATSAPALVVPREQPRQEQLIRARALERIGAVEVMRLQDLSASALSRWVASAVRRKADRSAIDRDGLARSTQMAATLLGLGAPLAASCAPGKECLL